jgi:hypothetical protein
VVGTGSGGGTEGNNENSQSLGPVKVVTKNRFRCPVLFCLITIATRPSRPCIYGSDKRKLRNLF